MNLFWAVMIYATLILLFVLLLLAVGYDLGWRAAMRRGRKARGVLAKEVKAEMDKHPMEDVHGDVTLVPFEGQVKS